MFFKNKEKSKTKVKCTVNKTLILFFGILSFYIHLDILETILEILKKKIVSVSAQNGILIIYLSDTLGR